MLAPPLCDIIEIMKIDGKKISIVISKLLKKEVKKFKKRKLKLVTFLIGDAPDQESFVKIKAKTAKRIGLGFELIQYKTVPSFQVLAQRIKSENETKEVTGIIIQQPLPAQLSTDTVYDYVDLPKEIEGHKNKSTFLPPLGLAVLTILKYIFTGLKMNSDLLVDINKDRQFFKKALKNKKVVVIGRGVTGGKPIGKTLNEVKINYIAINSKTPAPQSFLKEADIIITAVGKYVITPDCVKPGAIIINAGVRKENNILKGDFEENEIKNIAGFYTPTPGGIGPIDVIYLYKNLIDAAKLQK